MKKLLPRLALLLMSLCLMAQTAGVEPVAEALPEEAAPNESVNGTAGPAASVPAPAAGGQSMGADPLAFLPSGAKVAIIPIKGVIYDYTLDSVQRRVDKAVAAGADVIVIELDTPGGVLTSALKISKYLKSIQKPTVAWINNEAFSAGTLIAAACDVIVMAPVSTIGDCAPIVPGMSLSPTERAKALSPLLSEFRDSAARGGYDYTLFHAMCELGVEVYLIEHPVTSERRLVNQADYEVMVKGAEIDAVRDAARQEMRDSSANSGGSGGGGGGPNPLPGIPPLPLPIPGMSSPSSGTLGTLGGSMPEEQLTSADRGNWTLVKQIHDGRSLMTLHQGQAQEVGLTRHIIGSDTDVQTLMNSAAPFRIKPTWSEHMGNFLTSNWVRAILVVLFLLGAYMEMQAPGISVPGTVAAVALILLMTGPFLVGLAEIWHIIVFFLGFILLMIELLVIPGFGVVGIIGIVLMLTGIVLAVIPTAGGGPVKLPAPEMMDQLQWSIISIVGALVASGIGFVVITRYLGSIPAFNRLVLGSVSRPTAETGAAGVYGGEIQTVSGDEVLGAGSVRVGDSGRSVSELRPSGRANIAGKVVDVITPGTWIDPGRPVRVVEIQGNRIVVEAA